jgi:putative transposase
MKKRKKYAWLNEVSNNVVKQAVKDACKPIKPSSMGKPSIPIQDQTPLHTEFLQ